MTPSDIERVKDLLPTTLGSDEIRSQLAADILRRSVFSARMASVPYLAKVREVCAKILEGTMNQASARNVLEGVLDKIGHSMQDDGGLSNPASIRRLNLIVETQTAMAANFNTLMQQTEATLDAWPAWDLRRVEDRDVPRPDWAARWNLAGQSVNWEGALETHIGGRMVALKKSPIWQALGDGVGGFKDTLRNPYPPFAYNSGLGWVEVTAEECKRLGLIGAERSQSHTDVEIALRRDPPSLAPSNDDITAAIEKYGMPPDFWEDVA